MKAVNAFLDAVRNAVRGFMNGFAKILNTISGGKLSPNAITLFGLFMHLPIAYLIILDHWWWAAGLLVVFGLFDALDGALARLQKRASNAGMLLDATTDRMKEVILYTALAFHATNRLYNSDGNQYYVAAIVAACGGSLLVSYVKAKGETAVAGGELTANEVNRLFQDGFMRFEIRMFLLIVGLVTSWTAAAVVLIAIGSWLTAFSRLIKISRKL
jgi:phosphatidylglycerophosphate synthase